MTKIAKIWAREILDSRGIPTVEAFCQTENGYISVSSVPSGTSTGSSEALELRDNDPKRFHGKGVLKAVDNINSKLGPAFVGDVVEDQVSIDKKLISLDGTKNKSKYGANAILAVSIACIKAAAMSSSTPLYKYVNQLAKTLGINASMKVPTPLFNMINGGLHGAGNLDFQEFHVIPATSKNFHDGLRIGAEIYTTIGVNLKRRGAIHSVGFEGGYAPNLFTNADALEILVESIQESPYQLGIDVFLGLDVAASYFYKNGSYTIRDKSSSLKDVELMEYYKNINSLYHLALIEDCFYEEAWDSWQKVYNEFAGQVLIVGDDLLSTSPERVQRAIKEKACDTILVKPNQIGTVCETINVIKLARSANWKIIVSHRSGETNDWFIADFAVGVGSDYVKFGAPARGERVAKYNRLLGIESELTSA
ncbi:MAG: Enolase [Candidatus Woesebacteria bacterium GW2011_GWA1_39_21]|uniref:Enolase n=1 Tax=Candidatus Woesebacteria bacterium GW2011_GWA1_39_21 TaxID=1618550 RepID=A0A0G0QMC5_9BACT|nr:MAG: Enolase [Candidatus Woesebacteria bacterium GW2011_GWA1_39_21]